MKRIILITLLITTLINGQTKKLTIEESLSIGLSNSKELKIAESKVKGFEAEQDEYGGMQLPKLSFGASYTRLSDVPPFEVKVPIFPTPIKLQDAVLDNYNLKLSIQQPIFTGFRLSSMKESAENKKAAAEIELSSEKNNIAQQIKSAYYNYYKAIRLEELIDENLIRIKKHLDDTKSFLDNGLVTQNDYLKIEVQYNNLELQKINAVNGKELARYAFNKALGINLNEKTEVVPIDISIPELNFNYDDAVSEAKSNRAELKSTNYKIQSVESIVKVAKSNYYPSVYLFGNAYYSKPNQRIQPLVNEFNETWDAGVTLSWDLWDWGITSARVNQSNEQLFQIQTQQKLLLENIETEVYANYLKVISEYNKIKVSEKMVKSSEENYRLIKNKYSNQLAGSTDLLDAEAGLLESEISYTYSIIDLKIALSAFEKSLGRRIY